MKPNKKKPRIRNRPRNKANRLLASQGAVQNQLTSEEEQDNEPHNNNVSVDETESEDDMPGLEDDSKIIPKELPEENDAMKTIQRLIRDKLLKNQHKDAESKAFKDDTTPAANTSTPKRVGSPKKEMKVSVTTSSSVKPSKAKEKVSEKVSENKTEKTAFIQNLQKKMEQMMSNGKYN